MVGDRRSGAELLASAEADADASVASPAISALLEGEALRMERALDGIAAAAVVARLSEQSREDSIHNLNLFISSQN